MEIELDKTEQKIVDATIFLLDKEGMNGTTTKKIARDMEVVKTTPFYQNLLVEQAGRLKKKAYPVIGSTPANGMAD